MARSGRVATGLIALLVVAGIVWAATHDVVAARSLPAGEPVPAPQGPVLLRVHGGTAPSNSGDGIAFDRRTLERLGLIRYTVRNRWLDGPVRMTGVPGMNLLEQVGVPRGAKALRLRALNDYVARIPLRDFRRWPVMLALKMNGEYMSVRNKGPIWVVYPTDLDPALGGPAYQSRWVWQLSEIWFE